jgi:hypothetical protein
MKGMTFSGITASILQYHNVKGYSCLPRAMWTGPQRKLLLRLVQAAVPQELAGEPCVAGSACTLRAGGHFHSPYLPASHQAGQEVVQIKVGWMAKDSALLLEASAEMQRSKIGRRARIAGTVEQVAAPVPSVSRLMCGMPPLPAAPPKTS